MMRTLYTGESGLLSHQTRMDVVGNNIANVNTVGFKASRTVFADMLSQNLKYAQSPEENIGGTNPKQIGLGTKVESVDLIFTDGTPMSTEKNTDLCLSGDGLFVVQKGGNTYYTRNGAFEFDAAGNYVLPGSGHYVQGWTAKDGVIDTTAAVGNIQVAQTIAATPTTEVNFKYNLDADTPLVKEMTGGILYESVQKVPRTEQVWEEVDVIGTLEEEESLYNLNVNIGDDVYFLHVIGDTQNHEEDIDLSKNWTVKEVGAYSDWEWPITLEDEEGNTSTIKVISKGASNIQPGQSFSADTSRLRFKSTVNNVSPLEFSVNGINCKAVGMNHSVEIPGEDWFVVDDNDPDGYLSPTAGSDIIFIKQCPNGVHNGCTVGITLDHALSESEAASLKGGELKFSGEAYTATKKRPITITTYDDVVTTVTDGTYKYYNSMPIEQTVSIYDSKGRNYQIPVYFVAEGEDADGAVKRTDKWLVSLDKNAAVKKGETTSYEFVDSAGNRVSVSMPAAEIQFDNSGNFLTTGEGDITSTMTITYGNAAAEDSEAQTVTVNFADLTQYAGNTTVSSTGDGNTSGELKDVSIDSSGLIYGVYTNGVSQAAAQVAVAHFDNAPGLTKTGTSLYQVSANSGAAVVDSSDNIGTNIMAGYLEMSNVDVASEFADMIITQRGFQSNSKLITVGDEMLETAVNMKR